MDETPSVTINIELVEDILYDFKNEGEIRWTTVSQIPITIKFKGLEKHPNITPSICIREAIPNHRLKAYLSSKGEYEFQDVD